jgi:hypothetical protein
VLAVGVSKRTGMPVLLRVAILESSARYPSGPRERSAKPPFVGSNPTRASTISRKIPLGNAVF